MPSKVVNKKIVKIAIYDPPKLQYHMDIDTLYQILLNDANRPGVWVMGRR